MSRPLAWLLGLLGLALLTFLCVWTHASGIETDLLERTTAALDAEGFSATDVSLSGRDATLSGSVPDEAGRARALAVAAGVEGVRVVRDALRVGGEADAPDERSFALVAGPAGTLVVRGVVPDAAARAAVLESVRDAFPDRTVEDALTVGPGAAGWQASIESLIPGLGDVLDPGVSVEPDGDGGVVVLRGRVPSEAARARIVAAATAAVRSPYTFRSELVIDTNDDAGAGPASASPTDPEGATGDGSPANDQVAASGSADGDVQAAELALRGALAGGAVEFELATADLTGDSRSLLDRVAAVLAYYPSVRAEVQGHTDSEDSAEHNLALSQRRAEAVRAYLTRAGIDGGRLTARGVGEDQPIATNDTAEGRARNRRVVFRLRP